MLDKRAFLMAAAGWSASFGGAWAQGSAPVKKIVFWAGPKEHGAPGRHEYERDLTELAWQLEHATNLRGVKAVVKVVTKPPRDISELEDADALVIFGNGAWLKTETGCGPTPRLARLFSSSTGGLQVAPKA